MLAESHKRCSKLGEQRRMSEEKEKLTMACSSQVRKATSVGLRVGRVRETYRDGVLRCQWLAPLRAWQVTGSSYLAAGLGTRRYNGAASRRATELDTKGVGDAALRNRAEKRVLASRRQRFPTLRQPSTPVVPSPMQLDKTRLQQPRS